MLACGMAGWEGTEGGLKTPERWYDTLFGGRHDPHATVEAFLRRVYMCTKSLAHTREIPKECLYVVGWRGVPREAHTSAADGCRVETGV